MKKRKFFMTYGLTFLLSTALLTACTDEKDTGKEKTPTDNNTEVLDTDNAINPIMSEDLLNELYSKENYDYEKIVGDKEQIEFYKTDEIFLGEETEQAEDKYFIYFYSPECSFCNQFYPTLKKYTELDSSYKVYKLNVDITENLKAWEKYNLEGTPSLILYDKVNKKPISTFVGVQNLTDIPTKSE